MWLPVSWVLVPLFSHFKTQTKRAVLSCCSLIVEGRSKEAESPIVYKSLRLAMMCIMSTYIPLASVNLWVLSPVRKGLRRWDLFLILSSRWSFSETIPSLMHIPRGLRDPVVEHWLTFQRNLKGQSWLKQPATTRGDPQSGELIHSHPEHVQGVFPSDWCAWCNRESRVELS